MRLLTASVLLFCITVPTIAFAQDWAAAFPAESIRTYVPSQSTKVMIVSVDAPDASGALSTRLSSAAIVVSGAALGDVSSLGDSEIVTRAASQPVDQIAIVRLAGSPDNPTAVVTIYSKSGESLGGFTASETSPAPPSDGGGASQSEMTSASEESRSAAAVTPEARDEFLESYVAFEDWVGINQYGAVVASWSTPYKGQFREPLRGAKFYDYIEQPELAQKFRKRNTTRWIIFGSSLALMVGGTVYALTPLFNIDSTADFNATPLYVGLGAALVGSIGMVVGGAINPHPVEPSQARRLARDFNRDLARRLGIDLEAIQPQSKRHNPLQTLQIGIVPVDGGAMAGASVKF